MKTEQDRVEQMYVELEQLIRPPTLDAWVWTVTELGEVGSCLMALGFGMTQVYVRGHPEKWKNAYELLHLEMGQTLMMLITLANRLNLDLGECLDKAIAEMHRRCDSDKTEEGRQESDTKT